MKRFSAKSKVIAVVLLAGVIPWLVSVAAHAVLGDTPRIHEPIHQFLEITGSCIAIGVAMLLLLRLHYEKTNPHLLWMTAGLVTMGLLDGVHSIAPFGMAWSWLRNGSTFVGGLVFALVWVPPLDYALRRKRLFLAVLIALTLGVGTGICLWPAVLPPAWFPSGYSLWTKAANVIGGLGFLAAACFFLKRYLRGVHPEDLFFASHTLLFSTAGLLFGFSHLWGADWWVWHGARLIAYSVLLGTAYELVFTLHQDIALHAQGDLLKAMLEGTPDLVAAQDKEYRYLAFNKGYQAEFLRIFGKELQIGDSMPEALAHLPQERTNALQLWEKGLRGETFSIEHEFGDPNRAREWFHFTFHPIRDRGGRIIGAAHTLRNITEGKRMEDERRKQNHRLQILAQAAGKLLSTTVPDKFLQELFQQLSAHLQVDAFFQFLTTETGDALRLASYGGVPENSARKIKRLEFGEAVCGTVAKNCKPLVATHIQESADPKVQLVRQLGMRAYACNPLLAGSRLLGTLSFASRTRDQFEDNELTFFRTIADYVAIAEERAGYVRNLERLVEERTAQLRATVGELEHFSYTITHDMRAPLRAMQGFGQMLLEECSEDVSPQGKDYIRRISQSAARMDNLITDALNYSKVVREEFVVKPVDAGGLLKGILESYPQFHPPRAQVSIENDIPCVMGNEAGLTQCFSNLLGNAVKFVTPDTVPMIKIWAENHGDRVRLWFQDNGIGIAQRHQEQIFKMFHRLSKNYEGTGIGLALVRKVVERMQGEVGVESEPGKGSRFWVDLKSCKGE